MFTIREESDVLRFKLFIDNLGKALTQGELADAALAAGDDYARDVMRVAPVMTGQYKSSIRADVLVDMSEHAEVGVGSPMPQTRRLEYGFYGTDSLGRNYSQSAQPHWRPTWYRGVARYREIIMARLRRRIQEVTEKS